MSWMTMVVVAALAAGEAEPVAEAPVQEAPPVVEPPRPAPASVTPVAPAAPAAPARVVTAAERMSGALGFGFFGTVQSSITAPIPTPPAISVPLLGARYWTPLAFGPVKRLGVELAGGAMVDGGESDAPGVNGPVLMPLTTARGLSLHVGLPFALGGGEHMLVSLAPEFRVTAHDLVPPPPSSPETPSTRRMTGVTTTDLGLRAGAELFFSFIGLPNLSVEASVRLGVRWRDQRVYVNDVLFATRTFLLNTSVVNNPWDVFTGSVSAKYYF